MDRERLTILADFLDTVHLDDFYMQSWCYRLEGSQCGFAGCAMGWATRIPEFKNDGLVLSNNFGFLPAYPKPSACINSVNLGFSAAEKFFNIDSCTAHDLFSPRYYRCVPDIISPADVVHKIRKLLA